MRKTRREQSDDFEWSLDSDDLPSELVASRQWQDDTKQFFVEAVESLSSKQRNVLKLHYVKGRSVESIAGLYQVHRATIHRWIGDARSQLRKAMSRRTMEPQDLEILDSQLDLSLSRLLT